MTASGTIEIALSKKKLVNLLLLSVGFCAGGLWMIISKPEVSNPFFNDPLLKMLASCGAVLMGSFGIYFFTKKLFDKNAGLVINEEGIYSNATSFKFGLTPWSEISYIHELTVHAAIFSKQKFIVVVLKDPRKYISGEKNIIKRKLLDANFKTYGSPFFISTTGLQTNTGELLKILNGYFKKYGNTG